MINKSIQAVHFMTDEKFTDGAVELFECDKRISNHYYIIHEAEKPLVYVHSSKVKSTTIDQIDKCLLTADLVYLHSFYCIPYEAILKIPQKIKIVWFSWGFDTYTADPMIPIKLYHKQTLEYLSQKSFLSRLLGNRMPFLLHIKYYYKYKKFLSRVSYYSGVFPYEYELIKKYNKCFKAVPLDFYYGSTHFFIPDELDLKYNRNKQNIIIGNSAAWTNNHLDALTAVKKTHGISFKSVIVPLSYGGSPDYVRNVKQYGESLFGTSFISLDKFMPLEEYLSLVSNCKAAIYSLERQQASDNILMQIWYGAKVFLPYNSGMYKYLKSIGLNIYSLEKDSAELEKELEDELVLQNRRILIEHYSSKRLIQRIYNLTDIILKDIK